MATKNVASSATAPCAISDLNIGEVEVLSWVRGIMLIKIPGKSLLAKFWTCNTSQTIGRTRMQLQL